MKLLFFSDIHGVPETLRQLFDRADELQPDRLIMLGDALYHGPRNGIPGFYAPDKVAAMLNSRKEKIMAVRGNCDSEVDQMLLQFPIMADYAELLVENQRFFLTHGHLWNAEKMPQLPENSILAHGHTHVPEISKRATGITIFNPGSISLPKQDFPRSFGFFDGSKLSVRELENGNLIF